MLALALAATAVVGAFVAAERAVSILALHQPGSLVAMLLIFGYCVALGRIPAALDELACRALRCLPLDFVSACALALVDLGQLGEVPMALAAIVTVARC